MQIKGKSHIQCLGLLWFFCLASGSTSKTKMAATYEVLLINTTSFTLIYWKNKTILDLFLR